MNYELRTRSLRRREVALPGSNLVAPVVAEKIDGAIGAVGSEIGRRIRQRILAAQLGLDVVKAGGLSPPRRGEKRLPAGGVRHLLQHLVALAAARGPIGADRIDDGF